MNKGISSQRWSMQNLPPVYELVSVVGPSYRVIGYIDKRGIWRRLFDRTKLDNVQDWLFLK